MSNLNGGFSPNGMWRLKRKLCTKSSEPPMAKKDKNGNLVTSPLLLKNLYQAEYTYRLRNRDIKPDY